MGFDNLKNELMGEDTRREYIEEELLRAEDALECILMFSQDPDIRREVFGAYRAVLYTKIKHYDLDDRYDEQDGGDENADDDDEGVGGREYILSDDAAQAYRDFVEWENEQMGEDDDRT
jgi:hypothetical protein